MSYDHWKTTNPDDDFLGPEPQESCRENVRNTYATTQKDDKSLTTNNLHPPR
jgi:hypothetical protein